MSLSIDVDKIEAVLIAGKWYQVEPSPGEKGISSFDLDAYEYLHYYSSGKDPIVLLGGGSERQAGIPATGFSFIYNAMPNAGGYRAVRISGPVSSIQAVRYSTE